MWVLFTLFLLVNGCLSVMHTRYLNVECEVLDPEYIVYKHCYLKLIARDIVGLNVHAKFLKGGFANCKVNLSVYRKFNGYRPFLINETYDYCKFVAQSNRKLSFISIVYNTLISYSNLNHSCPYEHDIIVKDLVATTKGFKFFPLPTGDYKIQILAAVDNEWRTSVKIYLQWILD